jgi:hypothetical protein
MTYAGPTWEFAADTHLMKLQQLQKKVLRTIDKFTKNIPIRDMHNAFQIPYVNDYITRQQAQVIQNHENSCILNTGQGEAQ